MILETNSPQETFSAGRQLGEKAFPGQVITLTGDLGVGKTVFTQGLAKGLGIEEPVNSPTFTIVQVYDEGRLPLYHFDVYRIGDIEEMDEIGYEDYFYGDGLTVETDTVSGCHIYIQFCIFSEFAFAGGKSETCNADSYQ